MTGLDVSAGGMKLAWPDAPPQGTAITASLPTGEKAGSVVWSNAHYAGVVFDQQLAQDEVDVILS